MTVDFSRTFVLAGEPSHVASIAIVDPEHFYPDAPHSRCAYRPIHRLIQKSGYESTARNG